MQYNAGEIIGGKYRVEKLVGEGAFGEVYLATHLKLNAPRALKVLSRETPGVQMEFVPVPAGPFSMGSDPAVDKNADPSEQPQHQVMLSAYWIGKTEVTNRQYEAFVKATGHATLPDWKDGAARPARRMFRW